MHARFLLFSIWMLTLHSFCYSQNENVVGKVQNAENKKTLPYVNIGIPNKTIGTVSNAQGLFTLTLNDKITQNDTVIFSYIGFEIKKQLISDLSEKDNIISLSPKDTQLDEVIVSSKKIKLHPKKIGRASKGLGLMHTNFYTFYEKDVDDRLSKERGMKLNINRNCHINALNFNITSNDFKTLKFRVNFYKINPKTNLPTDRIVKKDIIFEIKDGYLGWFKVDLAPYKIYLKKDVDEVAVTIQWLESVKKDAKSKYFAISTAASPFKTAYFRDKAMDKWTKAGQNFSFYLNAMCE